MTDDVGIVVFIDILPAVRRMGRPAHRPIAGSLAQKPAECTGFCPSARVWA